MFFFLRLFYVFFFSCDLFLGRLSGINQWFIIILPFLFRLAAWKERLYFCRLSGGFHLTCGTNQEFTRLTNNSFSKLNFYIVHVDTRFDFFSRMRVIQYLSYNPFVTERPRGTNESVVHRFHVHCS